MSTTRAPEARTVLVAHPGADLYGSDRVMLDTVSAWVHRGWRVVVTLPGDGPLVELLRSAGADVRARPTPVLRKSALRPAGAVQLVWTAIRSVRPGLRLIRDTHADVVYVSTVTIPLWLVLARLLRRPVMCHVHEAETSGRRAIRVALAAPLVLADRIVANSRFSLQVLTDSLPRLGRRARVIANPVPGPPEALEPRATLDAPLRVLYVGRLSPRKGPHVAVDAVAELTGRGIDVRLDLLGSVFPGYEWYEHDLRAAIDRDGLTDRVDLLGFRSDVWPTMATADVVVVPSLADEPFGNTAVEAVLAARPVVVSDGGGLTEAIDGYRSATAVTPGDPAAIAAELERIAGSWAELRDDALADAATARERHDPERYGDRMDLALSELVDRGARR
jgi:glycosyltransferase involved in cell wall biosynthesis